MPKSSSLRNLFRSSATKKRERYNRMMEENKPIHRAWTADQKKQNEQNKADVVDTIRGINPESVVEWRKKQEEEKRKKSAEKVERAAQWKAYNKEKDEQEYAALLARNKSIEEGRAYTAKESAKKKLELQLYDLTPRGRAEARKRGENIDFILDDTEAGGGRRRKTNKRRRTNKRRKTNKRH